MADATIATSLASRQQTQYSLNAHAVNGQKQQIGTITFDGGTYVTGGIAFTVAAIPATKLSFIEFNPVDGYLISYDYDAGKVQVWEAGADGAALDEFTNGEAISLVTRYLAIGY